MSGVGRSSHCAEGLRHCVPLPGHPQGWGWSSFSSNGKEAQNVFVPGSAVTEGQRSVEARAEAGLVLLCLCLASPFSPHGHSSCSPQGCPAHPGCACGTAGFTRPPPALQLLRGLSTSSHHWQRGSVGLLRAKMSFSGWPVSPAAVDASHPLGRFLGDPSTRRDLP